MSRFSVKVQLRLVPTELGGRKGAIFNDYRPDWDLKNRWHGEPTLNGGRVLLDSLPELAPGAEGPATIEPLAEEFWGAIEVGAVLPMHEGSRIVGHATVVGVMRPAYLTREAAAFVDQAHQFCDFLERGSSYPLGGRLEAARTRLLELYRAGLALSVVEAPEHLEGFDAGPRPPRPDGWAGFDRLERYWEVLDPYVNAKPVASSLSEDLLEVYFDMRHGLERWKSKASRAAVLGSWRLRLDTHWGDHAVDALRALHRARRSA